MSKHIGLATSFLCIASTLAGCAPDAAPPRQAIAGGYAYGDRPSGLPTSATSYRVTHLAAPLTTMDWNYNYGGTRPVNRLGIILGAAQADYSPAVPIQARYDQAVSDGTIGLTLLVERYPEGSPADIAVTLDTRASDDGFTTLWGVSDGDRVEATGGDMSLSLSIMGGVHVHAQGLRVEATVADDGTLHGRLNGIVPESELVKVYPVVAAAMNDYIAHTTDHDAATTLQLFDTDRDGKVSVAELQASQLIQNLALSDVTLDVVDVGTVKGLSFGFGFDAVKE